MLHVHTDSLVLNACVWPLFVSVARAARPAAALVPVDTAGCTQDNRNYEEGNEKESLGVVWGNRIRGQDVVVGGGGSRSRGM